MNKSHSKQAKIRRYQRERGKILLQWFMGAIDKKRAQKLIGNRTRKIELLAGDTP